MVTALDALGRRHLPAGDRARIVSLVPSITELLFALDLGDQVVGRTSFCVHPRPEVERVARVGGTKTPRLERIRALAASHAVLNVDENRREDARALADMGVEVIATHPLAMGDNPGLFRLLGSIFGREVRARDLSDAFLGAYRKLREATARRARRRVLYLIWRDPWMTVSPNTYIARTLADAGMDIVAGDGGARYPTVAMTPELLATVDTVLLPGEPFPFKPAHAAEVRALARDPALDVRAIDGEMTSWYGSRAIEACAYLERFSADLARRTR